MRGAVISKQKRKTVGELEAIADQQLAEMKRLNEAMLRDRSEIETLKTETARLANENRIVLTRLKAMW